MGDMSRPTLAVLGQETFGQQLRRCRERSGGVSLREAATRVSQFESASRQRLLNLEAMEEAPTDAGRRLVALLAFVVYGYDPEQFGLSWKDLPKRLSKEAVIRGLRPSPITVRYLASFQNRSVATALRVAA